MLVLGVRDSGWSLFPRIMSVCMMARAYLATVIMVEAKLTIRTRDQSMTSSVCGSQSFLHLT